MRLLLLLLLLPGYLEKLDSQGRALMHTNTATNAATPARPVPTDPATHTWRSYTLNPEP